MDAEEYLAQYGANLTESEQRYIRAFGAPAFTPGPSRNPYTPGMTMGGTSRAAHDGGASSTTVEAPHET